MVADSDPVRAWGKAVASILVDSGAAPDEAEGWKLAGKLMAGAHMNRLDGLVPIGAEGELGRAWAVDFLAGRPSLLRRLEGVTHDLLPSGDHREAVMALIRAADTTS